MVGAPDGARLRRPSTVWPLSVPRTTTGGSSRVEVVLAVGATAVAFVLAAFLLTAARDHVPTAVVCVVILAVASWRRPATAGILYALPIGVVIILAFDWDYLLPLRDLDAATVLLLGLFASMSVIVGAVTVEADRRAVATQRARAALADEQAALRRVATLVAKAAPATRCSAPSPPRSVASCLPTSCSRIARNGNGSPALVGEWSGGRPQGAVPPDVEVYGRDVGEMVCRTRTLRSPRPEWDATGTPGTTREHGYRYVPGRTHQCGRAAVGSDRRGVVARRRRCPSDAEDRLGPLHRTRRHRDRERQAQIALTASRARIVTRGTPVRRRIQRDLHDGAQQRLVLLGTAGAGPCSRRSTARRGEPGRT